MGTPAAERESALAAIEALWLSGRPLEAGRALTALIPPEMRPRWAASIVRHAYGSSRRHPEQQVVDLLAALTDDVDSETAAARRDAVAALLNQVEHNGRFDSLHEALLTLALNAARLLVAATADTPPEPKEGWWFVASLKCVADELDDTFMAEAWDQLRRLGS